jgi:hypothetical protein
MTSCSPLHNKFIFLVNAARLSAFTAINAPRSPSGKPNPAATNGIHPNKQDEMRFGDRYIENVSQFESEALEELPEFPVPVGKLAELVIVAEPGVEVEVEDWAVLLVVGAKTDVSDSRKHINPC